MMLLAIAVAAVIFALALLHAFWGFGGVWPAADSESLSRTVTGFEHRQRMPPPAASFIVSAWLLYTAVLALVLGGVIDSPFPYFLLGPSALTTTLIFLARGVIGYTKAWRRLTPMEPFASFDRLLYSPLCLLLGAGFFTLGIRGFSA